MTFVEAAIEILKREGRPLSSRQLAERAVKLGLLSVVGRDPEATMQARLDDALAGHALHPDLVRTQADTFGLRVYPPPPEPAAAAAPAPEAVAPAGEGEGAPAEKRRRRRRRGGKGAAAANGAESADGVDAPESADAIESGESAEAAPAEAAATGATPSDDAAPEKRRRRRRGGRGRRRSEAEAPADDAETAAAPSDEESGAPLVSAEPSGTEPSSTEPPNGEPEQELLNVEAEELEPEPELESDLDEHQGPVLAPAAGAEDITRTDDERTVRPEIFGRSDDRRRDRDRDRKKRHKGPKHEGRPHEGKSHEGKARDGKAHEGRAHESRAHESRAHEGRAHEEKLPEGKTRDDRPAPRPPQDHKEARERGVLGVVAEILRGGDGRPMHVRHLVDLARKRHLFDERAPAADQVRLVRVAVLQEVREREAEGLRPRVRSLGGGQVALVDRKLDGELAQAERELQERAQKLRDATAVALRRRVARISPPAFETLGRVLAERLGIANLTLVRRGDGVSYWGGDRARSAGGTRALVALRPGEAEVNRRAVGELRAGLAAKGFDEGLLFAAGRPNDEALAELKHGGVTLYDGQALAALLVEHGLGVKRAALVVEYLDLDFFSELTES